MQRNVRRKLIDRGALGTGGGPATADDITLRNLCVDNKGNIFPCGKPKPKGLLAWLGGGVGAESDGHGGCGCDACKGGSSCPSS